MKTPRKTEQEWIQLLADCKARPKGVRIADWCEQQGINMGTYKYWRKKLNQKQRNSTAQADIQFVPLTIPVKPTQTTHHHTDISIRYKEFEIVVTEQSSSALLARLLAVVRESC